jgi:hypothetical protein
MRFSHDMEPALVGAGRAIKIPEPGGEPAIIAVVLADELVRADVFAVRQRVEFGDRRALIQVESSSGA